jgi:CBS domain-containing protein
MMNSTAQAPARATPGDRVRDLMTRQVVSAREHDTLAFASQILLWRGMRHLPVLDAKDRLVGMLSDRDLLRYVVEGPAGALPLREVMSTAVETIDPDAAVSEASARLAVGRIDALPVVRDGRLLGIISTSDILAERGRILHKSGRGRIPTAADVMSVRVLCAHQGDSLLSAIQKLVDAEVRHLPVVDDDHRVVGILSDRDVRTVVGDPRSAIERWDEDLFEDVTVGGVMTRAPVTVPVDASVLAIAEILIDDRVGAIPVVTLDDKLVGIVSYVDVIGHFAGRRS